jgi:hypothetical protein
LTTLSPQQFVAKWRHATLKERSAAQSHFNDLCTLLNPPLLIVSDLQRIVVHTNFTNTVKRVYELALDDLLIPDKLDILRKAFTDPDRLRPGQTPSQVTEEAARHFARLAQLLRRYGNEPHATAHFPFPWPPGREPADDLRVQAVAAAAADLVAKRDAWLNPPQTFEVSETSKVSSGRTLTALYNARPAWLDLAHRALDAAVLAAYGWPVDVTGDEILARLLALNLERAERVGDRSLP